MKDVIKVDDLIPQLMGKIEKEIMGHSHVILVKLYCGMCLDPKLQKLSKFCIVLLEKIRFLAITLKINILGHMLLHKLYINVAIAKILLYLKSF